MTTEIKYFTKEEAIQAVTKNGYALAQCSSELQNDEEVVMTAIKKDDWSFEDASAELKSNKTFILKALNEGVDPWCLIKYAKMIIQSDIEIIFLALEKDTIGWPFFYAKGEAALNKELAAKAIVNWKNNFGVRHFSLWDNLHPTLQEFFPKDSFYEKAKTYLFQLEQDRQAKLVTGGSTAEDGVVW